jgi:hypothetical protein
MGAPGLEPTTSCLKVSLKTLHMPSRLAFFVAMTNVTNPDDE